MPKLFGRDWSRGELSRYLGDMDQVAGVTRLAYTEGTAAGVEVARFRTGSGLEFDVLPSRALDIAHASYNGMPLAWISPCGVRHPAYYEPEGLGWLRSFFGGLVTTCGLLEAGSPGADPDYPQLEGGAPTEDVEVMKLGLHGRINNLAARHVNTDAGWEEDAAGEHYVLRASGRMREAIVFGENLECRRSIEARLGESALTLRDEVTNLGHATRPQMMLYHINLGWPLVAPGARLVVSADEVEPRDDDAAPGLSRCNEFSEPQDPSAPEEVFYHHTRPDDAGWARAAVYNPRLEFGLGIAWRHDTLPELVQWKSMKRGTYACGIEPANCRVGGRAAEREAGRLKHIEPGQTLRYELQIRVFDDEATWFDFERQAER